MSFRITPLKQLPIKPKFNQKEYMKEYKQKQKNRERKKEYDKKYYRKNRETIIQQQKELRQKCLDMLGNKCLVCGSTERLHFHEKNNERHNPNLNYIYEHIQDFVLLCFTHHLLLHKILEYPEILKYPKILELLGEDKK